jgi:polysaccharide biosynthesis transport protein
LQGSMNKLYAESNTPNGIPTRAVLDEWLKTTLAYEQSKAKLTVMDKRKKEFVEEYRKFAPLGAILKKIERQIGVSEKEYLELLHGLSMARLAQQNTQLTSKITVVDPPYFPLSPNASKRMLQVIVGGLVGFILVLVFLLTRALINKTIQQPSKVKKIIGEPVLGIYPLLNEKKPYLSKANLRLVQQIMSKLDMTVQPVNIGFLSAQKGEGKTTIVSMLQKELDNLGYRVERNEWQLQSMWQPAKNTQLILTEFPAMDTMPMLPGTLPHMQQSFLVCRANRIWTKIDTHLLDMYKKVSHTSPMVLLNGVSANFAEEMIGEVPKKRSRMRLMFKRLMRFQFGNRNKIK